MDKMIEELELCAKFMGYENVTIEDDVVLIGIKGIEPFEFNPLKRKEQAFLLLEKLGCGIGVRSNSNSNEQIWFMSSWMGQVIEGTTPAEVLVRCAAECQREENMPFQK